MPIMVHRFDRGLYTPILPYTSFEVINGQPKTPVTAAPYLQRVSMQRSTVDVLGLNTNHTTVHPSLLANMTWVYGLKLLLRKLWASGLWKQALMLRRLRSAGDGRMIVCIWGKSGRNDWFEVSINRATCDGWFRRRDVG